ncbi:HEPN domain-containing protein [Lysobacter capsici]|uniref:HEPN domain-containing protein n=1 Tax=Lysobacter capsici TaxID=435897 RepID=UPI0009EB0D6B|nr:HEPN domain-containing protein [Lysobacter capsici]
MNAPVRSQAYRDFEHGIQDAQDLLDHYDKLNEESRPPPVAEVLKRTSLVMAITALETYIEDRMVEAAGRVIGVDPDGGRLARFYRSSLKQHLKQFHAPNVERVRKLFKTFLDIDVTDGWNWNNYPPERARAELDKINQKRGLISHRSNRPRSGDPAAHVVTRDDLRRHIRFIRDLVAATDDFLEKNL